ncbi:MAG: hypothetical protein P8Y02_12175 [Deinococcales bacterium]
MAHRGTAEDVVKKQPILLEVPEAFETERLLLRAMRPGAGEAVAAAVAESLEELHTWIPWSRPLTDASKGC